MSQKPRERHFEKLNSKGELVEIIEETLPGKKEAFGQMLLRTENHNLYGSGMKTLPGEKRYREILKQKKEGEFKCICGNAECICGHDKICICEHDKTCICGHDETCNCGLDEEEKLKKKKLEEEKRRKKLEEERKKQKKLEEEKKRLEEEERKKKKLEEERERKRKLEEEKKKKEKKIRRRA